MEHAVLHLRGVSKAYGRATVLEPLDLSLRRGQVYGLIGENGAGKSTLIRIMTGLSRPSAGSVSLFGATEPRDINRQRARVGYVPDANATCPSLSARQNLAIRCTEWGLPPTDIDEALRTVGLASTGRKKVRNFSLGMRRRLDLAMALLGNPELLILDEPTNGLDPLGIIEVRELLRRLNRERGTTVLVSSHILSELHETATHYLVLSQGQLLESVSAHELDARCADAGVSLETYYLQLIAGARR